MKKGVIALIVVGAVILLIGILISLNYIVIRIQSKKYDLIDMTPTEDIDLAPEEEGYATLSEMTMHYLRYGHGSKSMVLIHGNGGSAESLSHVARYFAEDYTVYCIADRCQGKSSDPGVISYELMAKDVYEFICQKSLDKPYIIGHSDGGMVGIALAANYPDSIGALVSIGSNSNPKTFKPKMTLWVKFSNLIKKDKLNDLMLEQPDFNEEYLARITAPTYIVAGEYDIMYLSDVVYLHEHIAGSKMSIYKGADHSAHVANGSICVLSENYFNGLGSK